MITAFERSQLADVIRRHVRASVADAFKGVGPKDDIPYIEKEARDARLALSAALDAITQREEPKK